MNEACILHCHIFKNAGTSIDDILKKNFGRKWAEREFSEVPPKRIYAINDWLRAETEILAFSSHTITGPILPVLERDVLLIANFRHPIDRLYSAYKFERNQKAKNFGAVLAKETSFAGYIRARLALNGHNFCNNFQSRFFASFATETLFRKNGSDAQLLLSAKEGLNSFYHIGSVGLMEKSNEILEKKMRVYFPNFKAHSSYLNRTASTSFVLEEKLEKILELLGRETYDSLVEANLVDLEIYDMLNSGIIEDLAN